jgi:hypothetical protein
MEGLVDSAWHSFALARHSLGVRRRMGASIPMNLV